MKVSISSIQFEFSFDSFDSLWHGNHMKASTLRCLHEDGNGYVKIEERKHHHSLCNFMFLWRDNSFILNTIFFLFNVLRRSDFYCLFVSSWRVRSMKLDHGERENWVASHSRVKMRENNLIWDFFAMHWGLNFLFYEVFKAIPNWHDGISKNFLLPRCKWGFKCLNKD